MKNYLWVVESNFDGRNFQPTVGVALDRATAQKELRDWRLRNPDGKFRLVKYISEKEG